MSKLTVTMLGDWHVGSGTGRPGNIDRLIQRDECDLPYIPAKTLTGILRDGCELVAMGLDGGTRGGWFNYLEYLFGSQPAIAQGVVEEKPIPAALSLRSAYFPSTLKTALKERKELISALTFVKPGVAIDSHLGTAKPDCLRFEEMARGGSYLEADYQLDVSRLESEQIHCLKALLVAGVCTIERLGGKRRRGAGRCQIELADEKLETALEYLDQEPPPLPKPKKNEPKANESASTEINDGKAIDDLDTDREPPELALESKQTEPESTEKVDKWYTIEFQLETQSPLIVHARTLGNLVSTLDYIPGAALLAIIGRQLRGEVNFGLAIANNQIIVSNATLEVDGKQGRSMPFALFQEKQDKQVVYNRLGEAFNVVSDDKPQLKGMRSGYVSDQSSDTLSKAVNTYNIVEDTVQRPNEEVGGVYSYEAISKYTKFRAKIHIQETAILRDKALECLEKLAGTQTEIGRSKKDDYGLVKITTVNLLTKDKDRPAIDITSRELKVWLLSDVLIRNVRLRPSNDPQDLVRELAERLGLGVSLRLKPDCLSSLARSRRTDSWQTRWGLPRPSLVGLSAGSCFLFEVTGEISSDKLIELERIGIGERRAEGYGQLCFNDPLLMTNKPQLPEVKSSAPKDPEEKKIDKQEQPEIYDYARTIEIEAWREAIRRQSVSLAADPARREAILGIKIIDDKNTTEKSKPSMSQLGGLRSIVLNSLDSNPTQNSLVNSWINKLPQKIKEKWGNDSLDKISALLTNPNTVWSFLDASIQFDRLTLTDNGMTALKIKLWQETVQNLVIDCIRAHKRDLEPNNNGTSDKSAD
jgi:CRISPR-associated protein Csx10